MITLSLDFGTSSVKACLVDDTGRLLCKGVSSPYDYQLLSGERVELLEKDLIRAMELAVAKLDPDLLKKVECLCYDTFSPSLVMMDDEGNLLGSQIITHLDRRSRSYSAVVDQVFGNEAYMNIAGFLPFAGGCSLMTMLWFKDHRPEAFAKTKHIGHLTTYLHYLFTGHFAIDRVNASMTGVYNTVKDNGWSKDIQKAFELPTEAFEEILTPGTILGELKPYWAEKLGVKAGLPVALGTNDMAAAQVGSGNRTSGSILNSAGSSDMIGILTNVPRVDPSYYLRCAADDGLWQMYATTAGGFAVDWFYDQFCKELTDKNDYFALIASVIEERLGNGKAKFWPYLSGDRQSLRKRTGAFTNLTLGTTREDMLCAMMCGIQEVLTKPVDIARESITMQPVIKITGGMVNDTYMKLKKAYFPGFEFEEVQNGSIRGNALLIKG